MKQKKEEDRAIPNDRLCQERHRRHWSQQEVADQIETTPLNVGRWERGKTVPHRHFRMKLCALFGKTEVELGFGVLDTQDLQAGNDAVLPAVTERQLRFDPALPSRPDSPLIGRQQVLTHFQQVMRPGGPLIALHGLPGVGKTALAVAVAYEEEVSARFADGILWAGLGPTPDLAGHLSRWGTFLGLSVMEMRDLNDLDAWALALRRVIGTRSFLLVLDDVWSAQDALAFRIGGRYCTTLVTTRFLPVAAHLAPEGMLSISELDEAESLALLHRLAPRVIEREEKQAHHLLEAVGGLPLALTLIGNYLRVQSASGHPRRLQAALDHLRSAQARFHLQTSTIPGESHPSLPPGTPLSLQTVIAVTVRHLNEEAQGALSALSVFPAKPASFSEEAALVVSGSSFEVMDALMDAGVLEWSHAGRYSIHQTIVDYARLSQPDNEAATQRLVHYACSVVKMYGTAYEQLEQESVMIRAAIDAAARRTLSNELIVLVATFTPFLLTRGQTDQALALLAQAESVARNVHEPEPLVRLLFQRAEVLSDHCEFEQAAQVGQEGLALARSLGADDLCGRFFYLLGFQAFFGPEDLRLASSYFEEGLALARRTHDWITLCKIVRFRGAIHRLQGEYSQAGALFNEGLILARQQPLGEGILGGLLMNLASVREYQGAYEDAKALLQEALVLARAEKNLGGIGGCLYNLGNLEMNYGHDSQATPLFQEGLALARQWDRTPLIAYFTWGLGTLATRALHLEQAGALLEESLAVWSRMDQGTGHLWTPLCALADYQLASGHIKKAEQTFQQAHEQLIAQGDALDLEAREVQARVFFGLARVAQAHHHFQDAQQWIEQSLSLYEQLRIPFVFVEEVRAFRYLSSIIV